MYDDDEFASILKELYDCNLMWLNILQTVTMQDATFGKINDINTDTHKVTK